MPIRDIIIPETSSSILDPISKELTYVILSKLGLGAYFRDNVYIVNDYTKPSLTNDADTHKALISKDRCDVRMSASMNPSEMKWDINSFKYNQSYGIIGVHDKSLTPIFSDPISGVRLVEHQLPCTMTLEFTLQFKDREAAFMAISTINNTSLKDSVVNYHDLCYEYPLGSDLLNCLSQIYNLRKSSLDFDFRTYLKKYTRDAVQYIQSRTLNKIELVIKRQDINAYGVLEYNQTAPTTQEQDNSIDRFVVEFTYTAQFARPDVLRLYFPVVINNNLVPQWMLRKETNNNLPSQSGIFQEKSITGYLKSTTQIPPRLVRLPEYDDFTPPNIPVAACGFSSFLNAVVLLEDTGPTTIDLLDIGAGYSLNPTTIEIMKLHGSQIFNTTGLFNISVYCNDVLLDPTALSIDENLVVTINVTNKLKRYHLIISEATKLAYLDNSWIPTLLQYRTFFPITIIRNLQILIQQGYCYIDSNNYLLVLIQRQIQNLSIDTIIATLIEEGHLNSFAYCYATTAEQFAAYLTITKSPVSGNPVYNEYVSLCISQGLIVPGQLATGYIQTRNGYPFLPNNLRGQGGRYFNLPLRIENVNMLIETTK